MPAIHISQREARRLRKRVKELEQQEYQRSNAWTTDWPGVHLLSLRRDEDDNLAAMISLARRLKHAVVVTADGSSVLKFFACPLGKG